MALDKEGYITAHRGTTKVKVAINENGDIASEDDVVAGSRYYSVNQVNASNNLADNQAILELFLGFVGASGSSDQASNKMTVTWGVA